MASSAREPSTRPWAPAEGKGREGQRRAPEADNPPARGST